MEIETIWTYPCYPSSFYSYLALAVKVKRAYRPRTDATNGGAWRWEWLSGEPLSPMVVWRLTGARASNGAHNHRRGLPVVASTAAEAALHRSLSRPVDDEALRSAIQATLPEDGARRTRWHKGPPGMVDAAVDTLRKAWRAGIDLQARSLDHPRLLSIANLEQAVLAALPPAMVRPADLVAAALQRLDHAATLFGAVDIVGITELSPCWRPLLQAIALRLPMRWIAGPRSVPLWLDGGAIEVVRTEPPNAHYPLRKRLHRLPRGRRGHPLGAAASCIR